MSRCISLWEPWASLWLTEGAKVFETRSWPTAYRGKLLVHAAKSTNGKDELYYPLFQEHLARAGVLRWQDFHLGCIIGSVDLIGCCKSQDVPRDAISDHEKDFGDWTYGRYVWERAENPVRFKTPIPYRGSQGFFDVPDDLVKEVS
jgi:activating signal cointegrator 1